MSLALSHKLWVWPPSATIAESYCPCLCIQNLLLVKPNVHQQQCYAMDWAAHTIEGSKSMFWHSQPQRFQIQVQKLCWPLRCEQIRLFTFVAYDYYSDSFGCRFPNFAHYWVVTPKWIVCSKVKKHMLFHVNYELISRILFHILGKFLLLP